jgi:hypothetical protein
MDADLNVRIAICREHFVEIRSLGTDHWIRFI